MSDRLGLALLALVALAIVGPMFGAQLGAVDDHDIVVLQRILERDGPVAAFLATDVGNGRFRPLYWVGYIAETAAWGQNVAGWYVDRLALLLATLGAGYLLGRLWFRPAVAVLVAALIVVGPQAEAWYRLGPQEATAVPLTLAGMALVGRRSFPWGLTLLCLAAFTKEPFILVPAVGMAWAWRLGARQSVVAAGAVAAGAALGIGLALIANGGDYYGVVHGAPVPVFGRYLLPLVIAAALAIGWALERVPRAVPLGTLAVVVLLVPTLVAAAAWKADTIAFAALIRELQADPRPYVLSVGPYHGEHAVAVRAYVSAREGDTCVEVLLGAPATGRCEDSIALP